MQNVLVLIPDFALILLGTLLQRWRTRFSDSFWSGLEQLMFYVLFPALIFSALTKTHIDFAETGPLLGAALVALLVGMLLAAATQPLFALAPMAFASRFQCAFRYNTYIGIAIAGKLYGEPGIALMGVVCGVMIPLMNVVSVWMLARHGTFNVWRELVRNPLILGTIAGLVWNVAGLPVPYPAQQFLDRLSQAAIAMGLLAVGAALKWRRSVRGLSSEVYILAIKLVAVPATAWWTGRWLGLGGLYFNTVVLFAALPPASAAYILTVRMGGDGPGVAWLISVGTLASMVTLSAWISQLG
ncbi:MAG: AEC family transporter [Sulfurifustaceae bacterium]